MKKKMNLLTILCAVIIMLVLAACGNSGNNQDETIALAVIPKMLASIPESPASDFEYRAITGGIEITNYIGTSASVRIPEFIEGVPVISIGERAFFRKRLTELHVPKSVINIERNAFSGNERLTNIILENNAISVNGLIHFGGVFWRVLELDAQNDRALVLSEDLLWRVTFSAQHNTT